MNRDQPSSSDREARRQDGPDTESPWSRLFIAVELPAVTAGRLTHWQQEFLAADGALRLSPPDQLHVTLVFLGRAGESGRDQAVASLLELEGATAFEATAAGIVGLPVNTETAAGHRRSRRRALRASGRHP
ncbi:MAG: 2'-5' RNA ligase family protein [Thermoleophilia bacterium]